MESKPKAVARSRRRPALTWIDFLVIAAIVLTFVAIVDTTLSRAKATTHNRAAFSPEISSQIGQITNDPSLIKARIRLATGGPWG
jgi:hypothetical protein